MGDYTPTTEAVSDAYVGERWLQVANKPPSIKEWRAEFDRWLAEHDAEVGANTVLGVMHRLDTDDPRVGEQLTQMHDEWKKEAGI